MISALFDGAFIPKDVILNKVDVTPQFHAGRQCLRLELDEQARTGELGVDFGDFPTFMGPPRGIPERYDRSGRSGAPFGDSARLYSGLH